MAVDSRAEIQRLKRVADQMVTAHSLLESRYIRRSVALDVALMVSSFFLLMISISSLYRDAFFGVRLGPLTVFGSGLIFVTSVAEWRVQWKDKSSKHGDARREYSSIKLNLARVLADPHFSNATEWRQLCDEYEAIGGRVVPIPDRVFLKLKQSHLRKVYISRLMDRYPFAPRWLVQVKAHFQHSRKTLSHEDE